MHIKKVYEIDGGKIFSLEEFYAEISRVLIPGAKWGRNLDAFNDILRGGFGTPEEGFVLRWKNSQVSRKHLGYAETVRQLKFHLKRSHSSNRKYVAIELEQATKHSGPTVFDWLVEIIQIHCPGGEEEEDGIELILE
jgi:RNAse (barnase) inhibitor barstar